MKVLLDANILYPSTLRDLFLCLHRQGSLQAFWTDKIMYEWVNSIQGKLNDQQRGTLHLTIKELKEEFKENIITEFESILEGINIRDMKDLHVISAAIKAEVDYIVTFNTRDFPNSLLKKYNIRAVHPDRILSDCLLRNKSFLDQAIDDVLKLPLYATKDRKDIITQLKNRGLVKVGRILDVNIFK